LIRVCLGVLWWSGVVAQPSVQFIANGNQWPTQFHFGADVPGARVFLKSDGFFFVLHAAQSAPAEAAKTFGSLAEGHQHGSRLHTLYTLAVTFENATPTVPQPGVLAHTRYNYFLGSDSSRWAGGVAAYDDAVYTALYPGVDLQVLSEGANLKYNWVVAPCADPSVISLRYHGAEHLETNDGNLLVHTPMASTLERQPYAYQTIGGQRVTVACTYRLHGEHVSYHFPNGYDRTYPLIIDPILIFSGYSGSTYDNWGNTATYDSRGNLYSGGMVTTNVGGNSFPITPGVYQSQLGGGSWDVAILKYDSAGQRLLYATYLGGAGTETPQSLVVNQNDELHILGATSSSNFPVTNGSTFKGGSTIDPLGGVEFTGGTDLFIAKLSADGSQLLGATYLGGSANDGINFVSGNMNSTIKTESALARNYGDQLRGDIITDAQGHVFIASNTLSADFPASDSFHGGTHDAIVAKLTPNLNAVVWSRLLGGTATDAAYSIKLNAAGQVYVGGGTTSAAFEGMNGLQPAYAGNGDGWVAVLSPDGGQIVHATYLGTAAYDQVYFIDLTTTGEVVAFGQTRGAYPVSANVYRNSNAGQFLHKLTPALSATVFSSVVGSGSGGPNISPTAFLVSDCNTIYLSGWGGRINSPTLQIGNTILTRNYVGGSTVGMPVSADAFQKNTQGNDFYFMVLEGDGSEFLYGTFLGGSGSATHVDGGTSRFDKRGIVYHAVCAGCGGVSDFPAVNVPIERRTNRSANCNNAAFKFDLSVLRARIRTNNVALKTPGITTVCLPEQIVFQNFSTGGRIYDWDFGDGTRTVAADTARIIHAYKAAGKYLVRLKAIAEGTCVGQDETSVLITVVKLEAAAGPDVTICFGSSVQLQASGGTRYDWRALNGNFTASAANPVVSPAENTDYTVTITDANGCSKADTVSVKVVPGMTLDFDLEKIFDCATRPQIKVTNRTLLKEGEETYFDFGDGTTSDATETIHAFAEDNVYRVKVVGKNDFCVYEKETEVAAFAIFTPNVITPVLRDGKNDAFVVMYGAQPTSQQGIVTSLMVYNRWGEIVFQSADYQNNWAGEGLAAGIYFYEAQVGGEALCKGWVHVMR